MRGSLQICYEGVLVGSIELLHVRCSSSNIFVLCFVVLVPPSPPPPPPPPPPLCSNWKTLLQRSALVLMDCTKWSSSIAQALHHSTSLLSWSLRRGMLLLGRSSLIMPAAHYTGYCLHVVASPNVHWFIIGRGGGGGGGGGVSH